MSPQQRSLVSLVAIVLALGATAVAWQLQPPPAPPPSAGLEPIFDFAANAVRAIDLTTWQGRLRATRSEGGWRVEEIRLGKGASQPEPGLTAPTPAELNETLDALVAAVVATPQIDRFAAEGMPLRDFGLDPPQAQIALDLESGVRRTLEIGALTVTTSALYARVLPSPEVFQIGSLIFNNVAAALFRLRALDPKHRAGEGG